MLRSPVSIGACLALVASVPASAAAPDESRRAALLLERATFGARPGDVEAVLRMGVDAWLAAQLQPERLHDAKVARRIEGYEDLRLSTEELIRKYPRPDRAEREKRREAREARQRMQEGGVTGEERQAMREAAGDSGRDMDGPRRIGQAMMEAKLLRATMSERQLEEVLVDFWFNHFNVYARKDIPTLVNLPSYERDAIRPHVLGTFHELLLATAQHPAMLKYLDNWSSTREGFDPFEAYREAQGLPGGRRRAGARRPGGKERKFGLNENYARELLELHTVGVDGGYSQEDIVEVARCFTGFTVTSPELMAKARRDGDGGGLRPPMDGRFHFLQAAHDTGVKNVMGHRIEAGGIEDGLAVLRMLASHPSTARFVCGKLARKFVSDTPSPEIVQEMVAAWTRTGGDIRQVLLTMFRSPRFVDEASRRTKVKTPLELVASSIRATGCELMGGPALARALANLGQPLYMCQPPTGYDEESATWLSAGAMLNRIRFSGELLAGRIPGVRVPPAPADVEAWAEEVMPHAKPQLSPEDQATLKEALSSYAEIGSSANLQAMALYLSSPAFQRQ